MTDPFPVGDIWVVGQRRASSSQPFPTRGGGTSGSGDDGGGIHQNEVNESDPNEPYGVDPCADPALAPEWNADAAAAEAAKEFARRASQRNPPETLNTREWGCYLYRASDGTIRLGPITYGLEFSSGGVGSVGLSFDGIDPGTIIGSVHSHGSGSHLPSSGTTGNPGDIQHLFGMAAWVAAHGGNSSEVRLYIVAQNQGPAGFSPYNQINVYNQQNAQQARDTFTPGPEVNPEAAPCPGT